MNYTQHLGASPPHPNQKLYWQTQHRTDRDICIDTELDKKKMCWQKKTGQIELFVWILS